MSFIYERARLILVGRVKQIRHGQAYPRFALADSFGDHFLLENAMDFVSRMCDPCKNQCKIGSQLEIIVFTKAKSMKSNQINRNPKEVTRNP